MNNIKKFLKFLKEDILEILLFIPVFACGLTIPISILVCCIEGGEIVAGILLSIIFGLPVIPLLGLIIWVFVEDYKIYIKEIEEEINYVNKTRIRKY